MQDRTNGRWSRGEENPMIPYAPSHDGPPTAAELVASMPTPQMHEARTRTGVGVPRTLADTLAADQEGNLVALPRTGPSTILFRFAEEDASHPHAGSPRTAACRSWLAISGLGLAASRSRWASRRTAIRSAQRQLCFGVPRWRGARSRPPSATASDDLALPVCKRRGLATVRAAVGVVAYARLDHVARDAVWCSTPGTAAGVALHALRFHLSGVLC
jgi:hypothetical protein